MPPTIQARDPVAKTGDTTSIAARYARVKAAKDAEESVRSEARIRTQLSAGEVEKETAVRRQTALFDKASAWNTGFWLWLLFIHAIGIYFFTKGFLLTRLVLDDHSTCANPPIEPNDKFDGRGTSSVGCWHPKTFEKAVVVIIDALRYDFTVPFNSSTRFPSPQLFHNSLPFLYETAVQHPERAVLLPFIADPPTTTLQRLKGLTTGTLPTFIDAGSNFAGTAIEEDNILYQLRKNGKRIVHLGDDTWTALFPGYFDASLSRAYDSFNVWDLHTVDDGVTEHIMPLLAAEGRSQWDVLIAHYLGVDHAGHRYGPNHPAMAAKLAQMDFVLRDLVQTIADDTLLVVMGDHGMDSKGDHGGESDDEVEATLWMYSKKGVFGRTDKENLPPQTAKERPVGQIDLVPTLSLLLGLPIPFNNLGTPIKEAFIGKTGTEWANLAAVSRMTAAAVKRYQEAYHLARGIDQSTLPGSPSLLWQAATARIANVAGNNLQGAKASAEAFSQYQRRTLEIYRRLWARFDVSSMMQGIAILTSGLLTLLLYVRNAHAQEKAAWNLEISPLEKELQKIEANLDAEAASKEEAAIAEAVQFPVLRQKVEFVESTMMGAFIGTAAGTCLGLTAGILDADSSMLNVSLLGSAGVGLFGALVSQVGSLQFFSVSRPRTIWGWMATIFTISQSIGFASNSYTIWEDSILLFFISTFGLVAAIASVRLKTLEDRLMGVYHALLSIALGWVASFSKLCREEQMPYCRSTYYASANSSTSAPWQLAIPFVVAFIFPSIVKSYYTPTRSYTGFAPLWISIALRGSLLAAAAFWTLDAADDGEWLPSLPTGLLKGTRVVLAQMLFAISLIGGTVAFAWASPCITILTAAAAPEAGRKNPTITVFGYANTHGARYFLLITTLLVSLLLVQKPMGWLSLTFCTWQILSLVEILDRLELGGTAIGPIMLALLASFHFFKTGHQATLSSIQWETAFIPLHTIAYPWSPLLVAANTFGSHILCTAAVPLTVLWKVTPRQKPREIANRIAVALGWFVCYFVVEALATSLWAAHLRRHLMLYRIFSPRWMVACAALLVVDVVGLLIVGVGAWINVRSVAEVFGWR